MGFPPERHLTPRLAIEFVRKHGVVLESAAGPVPSLAQAIAGARIRGSWWSHPRSHDIFTLTRVIRDSDDILTCRLVDRKITYVHRRLWSSLVRLAQRLPAECLAQIHETHTASGRHVKREVAFPGWVPAQVLAEASRLSEADAIAELGPWVSTRLD
jgi:hypothetical protein